MIDFRDFEVKVTPTGVFGPPSELGTALDMANMWIAEYTPDIVNIETITEITGGGGITKTKVLGVRLWFHQK